MLHLLILLQNLVGVYRSVDNGNSWCQIGPSSTGSFTPLSTSRSNQGNYNLVIISDPTGESCILGGIDLWAWQHTPNSQHVTMVNGTFGPLGM